MSQSSVQLTTMDKGLAASYKDLAIKLTHEMSVFTRFLQAPTSDLTLKFKSYKIHEMKDTLQEMYATLQTIEAKLRK